jgi:hypothetical protein
MVPDRSTKERFGQNRMKNNLVRGELSKLSDAGRLTPENVVRTARNKNNPLHAQFEWNDSAAARKYRTYQARELIHSFNITLIVNTQEVNVQEFVHHPLKGDKQGYIAIGEVRSNAQMARAFMRQQLAIANAYLTKAEGFAAVLDLEKEVVDLRLAFDHLTAKVDPQTQATA